MVALFVWLQVNETMKHERSISALFLLWFGLLCILNPLTATATNVPVFRYALERWPAEVFPVLLVARDSNADIEAATFRKEIDRQLWDTDGFSANAEVLILPSTAADDLKMPAVLKSAHHDLLAKHPEASLIIALGTPQSWGELDILWSAPADESAITCMKESAIRQTLERRILDGDSAIMLLHLPEGRDNKDAIVKSTKDTLAKLEPQIVLPDPQQGQQSQRGHMRPPVVTELRVSFPLVVMTSADKDPILRAILARLDTKNGKPPIPADKAKLYAVFGQGRAIGPLVEGDDLDTETLTSLCVFVTGPCSCRVKAQNPGLDLFSSVDWLSFITGSLIPTMELPPLSGATAHMATQESFTAEQQPSSALADIPVASQLGRNLTLLICAIVAILAVVTAGLLRR